MDMYHSDNPVRAISFSLAGVGGQEEDDWFVVEDDYIKNHILIKFTCINIQYIVFWFYTVCLIFKNTRILAYHSLLSVR